MQRDRLLILVAGITLQCQNTQLPVIPYIPPVTFTGYFNGDYDSLAGNRFWPNRCELIGDTVRIYCYSTFFTETNKIRHGDLLRLDLYPDSADGFQKRNVLFHLARYYDRNESYTINRGDTSDITRQFESVIVNFARSNGAGLELEEVFIASPPLAQGQYLQITDGHLFGNIRNP
ncbi:MAG: hypothetical protein JW863_09345 [Chitinispirillaceae bacterium]|nr:hypothetical protein [Chitinispirillaceae bacterium]